MKAEQLIPHYLAIHGKLSLHGIGTFTYSGSTINSEDFTRTVFFSEDSITYVFEPKVNTDDAFIQFLVAHTGKILSLVASDLETYLITGKQFLNIGKPLLLKDIGYLIKNQTGVFEFQQGVHHHEIIDTHSPGSRKRSASLSKDGNSQVDEIDFSSPSSSQSMSKRKLIVGCIILLLVIVGVTTGIYNYQKHSQKNADNAEINFTKIDSTHVRDSLRNTISAPATDTIGFDLIIKYSKTKRTSTDFINKLSKKNLDVLLDNSDSLKTIYYLHYELPYRDTTAWKDSLKLKKVPVLNIRLN